MFCGYRAQQSAAKAIVLSFLGNVSSFQEGMMPINNNWSPVAAARGGRGASRGVEAPLC